MHSKNQPNTAGLTNGKNLAFNSHYDAVVIGGGIQGVGCAQALAAKGFSVLLLEKNSLGSGTSSRSSKLIHGGLRYLETAQISLVRKSLNERAVLCKVAPNLVKLKSFYLPIYRSQRVGPIKMAAGLALYALLGNLRRDARFSYVPKSKWSSLGGIKQQDLICVYHYFDAQTDDRQLTQLVAQSASKLGATIAEDATFHQADRNTLGTIDIEFSCTTQATHETNLNASTSHKVTASVVVNAAGPWVEQVQSKITYAGSGPNIALVQGTHIELDAPLNDGIFYIESPIDKRAVFVMPWQGHTMVGTTESQHTGDPGSPLASDVEVDYLHKTLLHYFPNYTGKLIKRWAGLRVLPQPEEHAASTNRPFSRQARDTIVHTDNAQRPQAISLYGGKLTAYRVTANDVLMEALKTLGPGSASIDTKTLPL